MRHLGHKNFLMEIGEGKQIRWHLSYCFHLEPHWDVPEI